MTIAAISPLAGLMPAAPDSATATNAPSDSGASFAAMLAGAHPPQPPRADAKDASAKDKPANDDKDRRQTMTRSRGKAGATTPAAADPTVAGAADDSQASDVATTAEAAPSSATAQASAATDDPGTAADAMIAAASLIAGGKDEAPGAAKSPTKAKAAAMTAPTVDMLAARAPGKAGVVDAQPADPKKADDKSADDAPAAIDAAATATPDTASLATSGPTAHGKTDDTAPKADAAGQTLAAAGTDRQVDLARQGAWLDGLARDISATADGSGTVRFQVSPQSLGTVHVEMTRGDDGSSVKFTAATEAARAMLDDAKPQFIADARAHGIRINDAQVDVGGSRAGTDQQRGGQQQASTGTMSGSTGGSAQGQAGGQSQPRSGRIVPEYQLRNLSSDMTDSGDASTVVASTTKDARYA